MTGMSLQQMASIAEIVGALTIVSGLVFGWFQIRVYRLQQRDRIATNRNDERVPHQGRRA